MKRTDYDCRRIGCWKSFALFFSSLLVITGRGELTECSKLTCFAKRMLDMVPGAVVNEIDDRCRLLSSIVGVLVRSIVRKIGTIGRIQTPKKRKKPSSTHESKFTNESQS